MYRSAVVIAVTAGALAVPAGMHAAGVHAAAGLAVSADRARLGTPKTVVLLSGRYSCGPFISGRPDRGVVDLEVVQLRNGQTARALGYLEPSVCDGTSRSFTVALTGVDSRSFQRGTATWSASGYVEGDTGIQHVHVPPAPINIVR